MQLNAIRALWLARDWSQMYLVAGSIDRGEVNRLQVSTTFYLRAVSSDGFVWCGAASSTFAGWQSQKRQLHSWISGHL